MTVCSLNAVGAPADAIAKQTAERTVTGGFSKPEGVADLVILVQHHREYDADDLARIAKRFFDTRGVTTVPEAHRL